MTKYLLLLVDGRYRIEEYDLHATNPEAVADEIDGTTIILGSYPTRVEAENAQAADSERTRPCTY